MSVGSTKGQKLDDGNRSRRLQLQAPVDLQFDSFYIASFFCLKQLAPESETQLTRSNDSNICLCNCYNSQVRNALKQSTEILASVKVRREQLYSAFPWLDSRTVPLIIKSSEPNLTFASSCGLFVLFVARNLKVGHLGPCCNADMARICGSVLLEEKCGAVLHQSAASKSQNWLAGELAWPGL